MKKITGLNTIVLVDDDKITNFINTRIIKKSKILVDIEVKNNGTDAFEYLKALQERKAGDLNKPGIIFLDINMPGMNGWDFVTEFNKLPEHQKDNVIIAMLTTSHNPNDENRAKVNPDIKMFLKKPLTIAKLEETISNYFPMAG